MVQAHLETARMRLEPLTDAHLELEVELDTDPEVMRFLAPRPGTRYRLLRRFWGRGLASEGARELVRHAFDDLGLARVFAETMVVNTASQRTMTRAGLRFVRAFPLEDRDWRPGLEEGGVEYAVDRGDRPR